MAEHQFSREDVAEIVSAQSMLRWTMALLLCAYLGLGFYLKLFPEGQSIAEQWVWLLGLMTAYLVLYSLQMIAVIRLCRALNEEGIVLLFAISQCVPSLALIFMAILHFHASRRLKVAGVPTSLLGSDPADVRTYHPPPTPMHL